MAFGMTSTSSSFTLSHHCDIQRPEPGRIRVTLQGLAHPVNSVKRKGLLGRAKAWWQTKADSLDSGWQVVWRFAQHIRDLRTGSKDVDTLQLRWRTLVKLIKSKTLRRCGVPAASNISSRSGDEIPGHYKFMFFQGTDMLDAVKRELLFNLRCRKVGFSRLPSRGLFEGAEAPKPHACDVHFLCEAAPIAWMWGLNAQDGAIHDVCMSSHAETSTAELRSDVRSALASSWGNVPEGSGCSYSLSSTQIKQFAHRLGSRFGGFVNVFIAMGQEDTDASDLGDS